MKSISLVLMLTFMCSCTYSINLVHTQGVAEDVVDETQKADADIKTMMDFP